MDSVSFNNFKTKINFVPVLMGLLQKKFPKLHSKTLVLVDPTAYDKKKNDDKETKKLKEAMDIILSSVETEKHQNLINGFIGEVAGLNKRRKLEAFTLSEPDEEYLAEFLYVDKDGKVKFKEFKKKVIPSSKPAFQFTEWALQKRESLEETKRKKEIVQEIKNQGHITE